MEHEHSTSEADTKTARQNPVRRKFPNSDVHAGYRFPEIRKQTLLVLLLITACLLAIRLWHIRADFPGYHFYSQDGASFTDEGFYTSAALHYFTLNRVYIPGGWNPGIFMPAWPLMVGLVFHFTGITVAAARSLAVVCTWFGVLLAYAVARQYHSRAFAGFTAFLAAANALGFFFGRLALLEPAFVMFLLLAIYLAGRVRPGRYALAIAVGLAFTATTLTKTTGMFVLPAVLYPIWAQNRTTTGTDRFAVWKLIATAFTTVVFLLGSAKLLWFHHYLADSRMILAMNPVWQLENSPLRLLRFFFRGTWIDPVLFPLALAAFLAATSRLRFLWRDTLFTTAFLWEAAYAAFIVFHYDGPPRYFVTMIIPTIWLALIFTGWLWHNWRRTGMAVAICIAVSIAWNLALIGNYLLHPRYSMLDASLEIKELILRNRNVVPGSSDLLIGRGAEEISLLSGGLPAIDSDGAMPLAQKLDAYHVGWFMTWTHDPAACSTEVAIVAENHRMIKRGTFLDLDPFDHAGLVLYQLFPKLSTVEGR